MLIVTPAPPGSRAGNRVTAWRWAAALADLGLQAEIEQTYRDQPCDLLIALHARKSASSVRRFRQRRPAAPLVVALTGTDLYEDLPDNESARLSIELATRLVVLQPLAVAALPGHLRQKARTILQSLEPVEGVAPPREDRFEVCVLGHLRPVKDPFRAAQASRLLPSDSRVQVVQVGAALEPEMAARARAEAESNPRYSWLEELPRDEALRVLARSRLLVLSSIHEGGANALSEALVHGIPVLATRIPGTIGLLGPDHPGYFPTGNTEALAVLLGRAEGDPAFYEQLCECSRHLAPRFEPGREREAWRSLLRELRLA